MYPIAPVLSPGIPEDGESVSIPFTFSLQVFTNMHWSNPTEPSVLWVESQFSASPHMPSASLCSSSPRAFLEYLQYIPLCSPWGSPELDLALHMCLSSTEQKGRITPLDLLVTVLLMKDKGGNAKGPYLHRQRKTDVHIIVQNSSRFFLHISVHVSSK